MINVGFLLNFTVEYKGGINYLKNLFYALDKYHSNDVNIILFVPENLDEEYINLFSAHAKIVRTRILKRKSFAWLASRIGEKYIGFDPFIYFLLKKNNINCISHSNYIYPFNDIKTINWIPDFQYLHYPGLWKANDLEYVKKQHRSWVEKSDVIIVSSYAAKKDLLSLYAQYENKVEVLHFVSQLSERGHDSDQDVSKLSSFAAGKFLYLPNQFWLHKNHLVVFKAIKRLKNRGLDVKLITTGAGIDYRDKGEHFKTLLAFVKDNDLESNIDFLGLVPYSTVFVLMQLSVAMINPSYFEGWSSTVEESKSIGKTIILSDIPVHKEQQPPKGIYFDPSNEHELELIIEEIWNNGATGEAYQPVNKSFYDDLELRTEKFSDKFYTIITKLIT